MFNFEPFKKIEKCTFVANCKYDPRAYLGSYHNTVTMFQIKKAREALNEAIKLDDQRHQENIKNMEFNNSQYKEVIKFMESIGIKQTYSTRDTKSRARYPKLIVKTSGYIDDILRVAVLDDGCQQSISRRNQLDVYLSNEEKKIEESMISQEKLEKTKRLQREADLVIARLIIKYNLDNNSTWDDVIDHLNSKDKYLGLASSMRRVRGDWNDGCGPVEYELEKFVVDNTEDQEIFDDVSEAIDIFHDEPDGRIFRDIKNNYDVLFQKVDPEILADYQLVDKYLS